MTVLASGGGTDYGEVIGHTLSPRLLSVVTHEAVALHHQSLLHMESAEAKRAFLNLIRSWPLHRATIFDVTQSFTSNWAKVIIYDVLYAARIRFLGGTKK